MLEPIETNASISIGGVRMEWHTPLRADEIDPIIMVEGEPRHLSTLDRMTHGEYPEKIIAADDRLRAAAVESESVKIVPESATLADAIPGIYRETDMSRVSQKHALHEWTAVAFDELIATARTYNAFVTYKELALRVQDVTGIRTRILITNWIGKLLEEVAVLAARQDLPPVTSLCVHQDGTIGEGYARAPKSVPETPGADVELVAAEHRLLCYRAYASDLPTDGGQPHLTPAESQRRARRAALEPIAEPACPECFMILPATGICGNCGWSTLD